MNFAKWLLPATCLSTLALGATDISIGDLGQAIGNAQKSGPKPSSSSSSSSSASSSSVAVAPSRSSSRQAAPLLRLEASSRNRPNVPEFRSTQANVQITSLNLNPSAPTQQAPTSPSKISRSGTLDWTTYRLGLSVNLMQREGSDLSAGVQSPVHTVKTSRSSEPAGTEFGGFGAHLRGSFGENLRFLTWWEARRSPNLKLLEPHNETGLGLYVGSITNVDNGVIGSFYVGPEAALSFRPAGADTDVLYGSQWGVRLDAGMEFGRGSDYNFVLRTDAYLRRATAYSVAGINLGGAGVLAASPALEYHMMRSLWVGVGADFPVVRPVGNETRFGDNTLAGLWGRSVGFTLRASSL
jgi:hypothetical protein